MWASCGRLVEKQILCVHVAKGKETPGKVATLERAFARSEVVMNSEENVKHTRR
jgi:hypothetical protein